MMIRQIALPAVASLVFAGTAASAEDWTGGYAGAQIGNLSFDSSISSLSDDLSYGVHAGYRTELSNNFVLGGELEYDATDLSLGAANVDAITRAKLIAGYDAGSFMPYAVLGSAWADTSGGTENGWVAGVGLGYQINSSWVVSGEVLHHEFDDLAGSGADANATTANIRVSYQF